MFSPEMMNMAQQMMAKMTPEQMAQMQRQAANMSPEMMQQAMNMAQNMSPEDLRRAQQMASSMPPEAMTSQAGNFATSMGGAATQQRSQYDTSMQLKNEGNALHGQKRYTEAAEKYERALANLQGDSSRQARELRMSCQGNLASCFLQLGQWQKCVQQCDDVLAQDSGNRKAYYRRGQAYSALGDGTAAVKDLQKTLVLSPENEKEAIREKLREAQQKQRHQSRGVVIEEVFGAEQPQTAPSQQQQQQEPDDYADMPSLVKPRGAGAGAEQDGQVEDIPPVEEVPPRATTAAVPSSGGGAAWGSGMGGVPPGLDPQQMQQFAEMMRSNPAMVQMAAERMRNMTPEQLQEALRQGGGAAAGITPEMARMAAESLKSMTPEQLRSMADQATAATSGSGAPAFAGVTPEMAAAAGSNDPAVQMKAATEAMKKDPSLLKNMARMMETLPPEQLEAMAAAMPGASPGMKIDPEQMRMAAKMMETMSPEDLERMAGMAHTMGDGAGTAPGGAQPALAPGGAGGSAAGLPAGMPPGFDLGSMPPDMMTEMRKKMEDPEMMKMVQNMMKSVPPETLAEMMSQSGMKVTPEQAKKMADSLGNMSEQQMQVLARLTGYVNRAIAAYQRAKAMLLSRGLLLVSLLVLLLAVLLRWAGWI